MNSIEPPKSNLLDAHGNPLPAKRTWLERTRAVNARTKTLAKWAVALLAVAAGIVTNIDKITGLFSGPDTQQIEIPSLDLSRSSVLAFETVQYEFGYAAKVEDAWEGQVETVLGASSEDFRHALKKRYEIVHLSAGFDDRAVWFDEEIVPIEQFRDMFVASGGTRLLVLDGCGSFAIGKVLEDAGLNYLVVASPQTTLAKVFFHSFYSHLYKGVEPAEAFKRALADVNVQHGNASDEFFLTRYR